jgi:hypothetical protein
MAAAQAETKRRAADYGEVYYILDRNIIRGDALACKP